MATVLETVQSFLLSRRDSKKAEDVPIVGRIISIALSLFTLSIISICLSRRIPVTQRWQKLPPTSWLIVITYVDSFIFVFLSAIIKDLGVNTSVTLCQGAILLCLSCYLTTKILIYVFLVEKAYIVRGTTKPRFKDPVYLFNACGLMVPYLAIAIMNFVYRIGYINAQGRCIIGMEKLALIPLITFDVIINVYLTILFLVPLRRLYSYQNKANPALRTITIRTFVGTCCTLTSSVVNLTVLTVLKGEPGWICLLACNADVLFSVLVLHWITVTDKSDLNASYPSQQRSRVNRSSMEATRSGTFSKGGNSKGHGVAIINTKVATDSSKRTSGSEHSFPSDMIHVRTDYHQEVEMDAMSSASAAWTDRDRKGDARSSSTDAIV